MRVSHDGAPYRRIWAAVLSVTIQDIRRHLKAKKTTVIPSGIEVPGDAGEALRWVSDPSKRPGSFHWVCDVLEYDPEYILDKIRRPRMADSKALKTLMTLEEEK